MHHKYVIRDGADVWTGSMNWTDDSWSRQENVIAIVDSPAIAKAFRIDFDQLWATRGRDAERASSSPGGTTASGPGSRPATARTCRPASPS